MVGKWKGVEGSGREWKGEMEEEIIEKGNGKDRKVYFLTRWKKEKIVEEWKGETGWKEWKGMYKE